MLQSPVDAGACCAVLKAYRVVWEEMAMPSGWDFAAITIPVAAKMAHDLIALRRQHLRHASIEHLADRAGAGSRITDYAPDGTVTEITIGYSDLRRARARIAGRREP